MCDAYPIKSVGFSSRVECTSGLDPGLSSYLLLAAARKHSDV